jgi:hypothetical protein
MGQRQRQRRERARAVELEDEHIAELEAVFELYCAFWDAAEDMPPRDALHFVLAGLSESGVSSDLQVVLDAMRALPFVESPKGTMSDRDRTWFGLQIMLNQLLNGGKRLLSHELLERLRAGRLSSVGLLDPGLSGRVPSARS